ncbi:hypothetical protein Tco_0999873 [Tanacetum coccineum]
MHRQSLGSPASKNTILFTGAITDTINSEKLASCSTTDEEQHKLQKPYQQHKLTISFSSTSLIHLIPILTFLCFLILYLSSHDPSKTELAQFNGFTAFASKNIVIDDIIDDNVDKNGVLEIRSLRNLQQQERRRQEKFGDDKMRLLSSRRLANVHANFDLVLSKRMTERSPGDAKRSECRTDAKPRV